MSHLLKLQEELYRDAFEDAHSIALGNSKTLLRYTQKLMADLPKSFTTTELGDVLTALDKHQIWLYGDFHTFRQSQRGLLRLLRDYCFKKPEQKLVIGMELFRAKDQQYIDQFMREELTENELFAHISYDTNWGFPWANFKMILDFAWKNKFPIIGINTDNAGKDTLTNRDTFAASVLAEAVDQFPDHKIVCMIGESHLAKQHLPAKLKRAFALNSSNSSILRIINNVDHYFFELSRNSHLRSSEYLKLDDSFYCIINSPPWVKWQSFSIWEEMRQISQIDYTPSNVQLDIEMDLDVDDTSKIESQLATLIERIIHHLEIAAEDYDFENFHLLYSPSGNFLENIFDGSTLTFEKAVRVCERSIADGFYVITRANTVLLTRITFNNLAEAAGQLIYSQINHLAGPAKTPAESFYRKVFKSALGFVFGKTLNPKRQTLTYQNHLEFIAQHSGRQLKGNAHVKRKVAKALVKHETWIEKLIETGAERNRHWQRSLFTLDQETNNELSRAIGVMYGARFFTRAMNTDTPAKRIKDLVYHSTANLDELWNGILELRKEN